MMDAKPVPQRDGCDGFLVGPPSVLEVDRVSLLVLHLHGFEHLPGVDHVVEVLVGIPGFDTVSELRQPQHLEKRSFSLCESCHTASTTRGSTYLLSLQDWVSSR